jgi:hypothetical protein
VLVVAAEATDPPAEASCSPRTWSWTWPCGTGGRRGRRTQQRRIEGTDVLAVRSDPQGSQRLSTVDVADLSSGVVTTMLTGQEQLLGREGSTTGPWPGRRLPLPTLPVR